jgi:hypothetical protein
LNRFSDTLWTVVRWAVPVTVAAVIAAVAIGSNRLGEEVRIRAEARLAREFPDLVVQVQGASVVSGEGLVLRGVSLTDPKMPQQWRQLVWIDEVRLACGTTLTDLSAGTPKIASVRVRRAVVHVVRHHQGAWNISRLAGHAGGGAMVPVSVEDGTLLVDDLRLQARTTLRRVQVDLQPEANDTVTVRGSADGDLFDRASVQGRVVPATGGFDLTGAIESIDVAPRLMHLVAAEAESIASAERAAEVRRFGSGLRGRIDLGWRAAGSLRDLGATQTTVAARLESGRYEHASLPFPLRDISAAFVADRTGVRCERLEAHTGSALLRGSGRLAGWSGDADFDLLLEAERLVVDRQWEGLLPDTWKVQWSRLLPAGEIDLRAQFTRRAGAIDPKVSVRCRNASLTHYRFPYRVDRTVGTVVVDGGAVAIHLTGQAGGRPVHIEGAFRSTPQGTAGALEVRGDAMRVDDGLLAAMPARSQAIVRSLRAAGVFDFVFRHERDARFPTGHSNTLGIRLVDCSMNYTGFPYPLTKVQGSLRMQDGTWTIKDIVGSNDTGTVRCTGGLVPRGADDGELTLELAGQGVVVERELRDALPRGARNVWDDLDPRGMVDFQATIRHAIRARGTTVEVRATPHGDTVSIEPSWFPYRLEQLKGNLEWKDGLLRFGGVRGRHARTTVATDGICRFLPDGGWHVSFTRLAADRFRAEHDVLEAMPASLRRAIAAVHPHGLLSVDGALDIYSTQSTAEGRPGPAAASWDMQLDLEQASLEIGAPLEHVHGGVHLRGQSDGRAWRCDGDMRIDSAICRGVQLTAVEGPLAIDAAGVRFGASAAREGEGEPRRLLARLAGGTLALDGNVVAGDGGGFTLAASLSDADLERITADTGRGLAGGARPYKGRVFGVLELSGSRAGPHSLVGRGQVRLRDADIYELPVVLAMLKVLRVKAPDLRAFGSSVIDFRVEGPRAYLDNIELSGDAISLVGSGELEFDSVVHLTFRSIMGDSQAQLPAMKSMLGGASGSFLLIHVDGPLANPDIKSEAFPTLAAALQQWQSQTRARDTAVPPPPPGALRGPASGRQAGFLSPISSPGGSLPPAAPASVPALTPVAGAGGVSGGYSVAAPVTPPAPPAPRISPPDGLP